VSPGGIMPRNLISSLKSDLACVECYFRLLFVKGAAHRSENLAPTSQQIDYMARMQAGQMPNRVTAFLSDRTLKVRGIPVFFVDSLFAPAVAVFRLQRLTA
jgi:hypothetical protein